MRRDLHPSLRARPGSPGLQRRTPIKPIGKKAEERFELAYNGFHVQWIVTLDCAGLPNGSHVEECRLSAYLNRSPDGRIRGRNEASHVVKRSRGGLSFHLVPQSSACHRAFEVLPAVERRKLLPLALRLAWTSHHKHPDLVPAPPVPEEEIDP